MDMTTKLPLGASSATGATAGSRWKRVGALAASSAFLMYLAEAGSHRLTINQLTFFMLAATADVRGKPATYSEIAAEADGLTAGIKNSYRQLLEPSRPYPKGLGWLRAEPNPDDTRESFLRLTDEGYAVVEGALIAMEPFFQ